MTDLQKWAIQSNHDILHLPFDGANTFKNAESPSQNSSINPMKSYLRVEHHTLTCLKRTGVIIFAVRTYLTPLSQIKLEGSGPALAEACESMPEEFGIYKNRPTWGKDLCAWLTERASNQAQEHHEPSSLEATCPFSNESSVNGT